MRPWLRLGLEELGAAAGAARPSEPGGADRALGPAVSLQGLPHVEDRVLERHLGRLEQPVLRAPLMRSRDPFLYGDGGHAMLLKTPTTRPRMVASLVRIGFMLLFSGCSRI